MFTVPFEILLVVAAFILGALEGARVWAALKVLAGKEVQFIEKKIEPK
jgi:hypothetical protein